MLDSDTPASHSDLPPSILALAADTQGRVWIGDEYTGLHPLDPTDGWNSYPSTDSGPSSYWIGALAVDEQGRVWAGNDWGTLNVLNSDERWITYTVPGMQILPFALPPIVKDIAFDNQGRVWIGTAIG